MSCLIGSNYNCQNGGTCTNINGAGSCICSLGYYGSYCNLEFTCSIGNFSSCLNGGTCVLATGKCLCPIGYNGNNCSICKK